MRNASCVVCGSRRPTLAVLVAQLFACAFLFEKSAVGWRLGSFLGIALVVLLVDLAAVALFVLSAQPAVMILGEGRPGAAPTLRTPAAGKQHKT